MATRPGAIGTLIAETGGLNVMLADSSALAEQLVLDVVQSGFNSAGSAARRCASCWSRKRSRRACRRCWPAAWTTSRSVIRRDYLPTSVR
jgi:hypothetical protein